MGGCFTWINLLIAQLIAIFEEPILVLLRWWLSEWIVHTSACSGNRGSNRPMSEVAISMTPLWGSEHYNLTNLSIYSDFRLTLKSKKRSRQSLCCHPVVAEVVNVVNIKLPGGILLRSWHHSNLPTLQTETDFYSSHLACIDRVSFFLTQHASFGQVCFYFHSGWADRCLYTLYQAREERRVCFLDADFDLLSIK